MLGVKSLFATDLKDIIKKVEIDGEVEIGVDYYLTPKPEDVGGKPYKEDAGRIGDLEVEFKIKPIKPLFVAFDLNYNIEHPGVTINKLYAGVILNEQHQFRFGYMRKKFGIESVLHPKDKRFDSKSYFSKYLKSFHVFGYDLLLAYKYKVVHTSGNKSRLWVRVGGDPSLHFLGNVYYGITGKVFTLHSSFLYVNGKKSFEEQRYALGNIGISSEYSSPFQFSLEFSLGLDPAATVMAKELEDGENVYFLGQRLEQSFDFSTKRKVLTMVEPIVEESIVFHELGTWKSTFQVRPGINFYFGKKKRVKYLLGTNFEYATVAPEHKKFTRLLQGGVMEVRILW